MKSKKKTLDEIFQEMDNVHGDPPGLRRVSISHGDYDKHNEYDNHNHNHNRHDVYGPPKHSPNTVARPDTIPADLALDPDGDMEMFPGTAENMDFITDYVNENRDGTSVPQSRHSSSHSSLPPQFKPGVALKKRKTRLKSQHAPSGANDGNEGDQDARFDARELDASKLFPMPRLSLPIYLVVDTNFLLSNLNILHNVAVLGAAYHYAVVVPATVLRELDGLKASPKPVDTGPRNGIGGLTVGQLARRANNWIYRQLAALSPVVRGQRAGEAIDAALEKDDAIHDCCLYFKEKSRHKGLVVLLSNDRNLCIRALKDGILTVTYVEGLTSKFIADTIYSEAAERSASHGNSHGNGSFGSCHGGGPKERSVVLSNDTEHEITLHDQEYSHEAHNHKEAFRQSTSKPSTGPKESGNPYLRVLLAELYPRLYVDVSSPGVSLFKAFVRRHFPYYDAARLRTPQLLLDAIKMNWDAWKLETLFSPTTNTSGNDLFTRLSQRSVTLKKTSSGNPRLRLLYGDDGGRVWTVSLSQELFLREGPKNLFEVKRYVDFWSTVLAKVAAAWDDEHERRSMGLLLELWDDAVDHHTD